MIFEWDFHKEKLNIKKHGTDFYEASTSFSDPLKIEVYDDAHSTLEDRYLLLGISYKGKLVMVSFVERSDDLIRIISARPATKQERFFYQQQNRP